MTIGERLEEARKRKGVSIREAAEATKIRGDYLLAMETNRIEEIGLPQIYVRGFLKNYARFVKADPTKILTDYDAYLARRAVTGNGSSKESLGRVELPDDKEVANDETSSTSRNTENTNTAQRPPLAPPPTNFSGERPPPADGVDNALYLKIAVISGSVGIVVLLLVLLINVLRSPDTPSEGDSATAQSAVEAESPIEPVFIRVLSMQATPYPLNAKGRYQFALVMAKRSPLSAMAVRSPSVLPVPEEPRSSKITRDPATSVRRRGPSY